MSNKDETRTEEEKILIIGMEFKNKSKLPLRFNFENENMIPKFKVSQVPESAVSLAIIMEDIDAPGSSITNWIVYNIDPDVEEIGGSNTFGTTGKNSWTMKNYQGAIPIQGRHTYRFTIYALDRKIQVEEDYSSDQLRDMIRDSASESGFVEAFAEKQGFFALA